MTSTSTDRHTEHGDRAVADAGTILRTTVGSQVHGIAIEGTDDHDEMGVYIEPRSHVYGMTQPAERYVWRTQAEGVRSGAGDTDYVGYSLRRYLQLAVVGNPTVLLPLFAPYEHVHECTPIGASLRLMRDEFLTQEAVHRFLGLDSQRLAMLGFRSKGRPNRPELVAKYGYDVKYASHAYRLSVQGLEVARDGTLTLPLPDADREAVLSIKRGEWKRDLVSSAIEYHAALIRRLLDKGETPLPEHPDRDRIGAWSMAAHEAHWYGHPMPDAPAGGA
jgi:hypothetical protein